MNEKQIAEPSPLELVIRGGLWTLAFDGGVTAARMEIRCVCEKP
jgi:hypothetical protein